MNTPSAMPTAAPALSPEAALVEDAGCASVGLVVDTSESDDVAREMEGSRVGKGAV